MTLFFVFIMPLVKNDLMLCVYLQFIAPSLYNQITWLIFITDSYINVSVQFVFLSLVPFSKTIVFSKNSKSNGHFSTYAVIFGVSTVVIL